MFKHPLHLSLRLQLLIVMLSMMVLFVGSLAYLQTVSQDKLFDFIQEEINGLTKAMEISVEQIYASGATDEARLKSYIDQLRKRGVEEVSILSNQQEVILSSNPRMIGSRLSVSRNEFLIKAKIGARGSVKTKKLYSAFVPIISKGQLEGYIHVNMYFDDLEKLGREMLFRRMVWMLPVFGIGVVLCILISYRYTKPIPVLIDAVRAVSQGRTPNLPKIPQADIRDLAESLDEMIHKLEEQKTMEEKLKRAEQEAMLAQLASGIAHEIRNPLNFISLSIDHLATLDLLKTAEGEAGPGDLLRKMKAEVRRINQMVTNFLDLGRELVLHPIQLRVDLPVEEALGLNSQLIQDRGISVQRNYPAKATLVKIDIDKMKSCFQNLIINAADSMPTGGTLSIRIEEGDGSVRLVFEDTGTGIRPEHLSQVFEPYFTTKNTGTGLGLAITKRIVEAHAGKIDIASTPGQGTRVEISIPHAG